MKTRILLLAFGLVLSFALFSCRKEKPQPPTIEERVIKEFSPFAKDTATLYDALPMLFKKDSIYYYHYKHIRPAGGMNGEVEKDIRPVGVYRGWRNEFDSYYFVFHLSGKIDKCYTILCRDQNGHITQTWIQEPFNKQEVVDDVEQRNWRKYSCYVDIYVLYVLQNSFKFYPFYYDKDIKIPHK